MKIQFLKKIIFFIITFGVAQNVSAEISFDCKTNIAIRDSSIAATPVFGFLCDQYDDINKTNSIIVKIKNLDGSLYNKITFGRNTSEIYSYGKGISIVGDIDGNDTPELVVLIRERNGTQEVLYQEIRDIKTGRLVKRVKF